MTTKKGNDWLDIDPDEEDWDEEQGYDSEAAEQRKGRRLVEKSYQSSKRRKIERELEEDDEEDDKKVVDDKHLAKATTDEEIMKPSRTIDASEYRPEVAPVAGEDDDSSTKKRKPLQTKDVKASRLAAGKTGVIYLSRIPPFMKPIKLRSLLSPYGRINRIFMTPEDPSTHAQRVRSGGNKKRSFVDGWVEFASKADAKLAAETLNTQIMGGKKGGFYHDDVWNIKYLRGFKWHHLTDQIANENAERAARLRAEVARTRKEDREFVRNVERAKKLEGMQRKRAMKRERDGEGAVVVAAPTTQEEEEQDGDHPSSSLLPTATTTHDDLHNDQRPRRRHETHFRQKEVRSTKNRSHRPDEATLEKENDDDQKAETVKRVLSKIF